MEKEDIYTQEDGAAPRSDGESAKTEEDDSLIFSIYNHINTILCIIVVFWTIKTAISATKHRWSAYIMHLCTKDIFAELEEVKKSHFCSMRDVVSKDPELRQKNAIRILEIGPGTGVNFAHYPEGSHLVVVDPNPHYKDYYNNNIKKFSHIKAEEFHVTTGENMAMVPDESVDVVVVTLVLCTVKDVQKVLKEIQRVLAPEGQFYFMEHVVEFDLEKHSLRRKLQHIFTHYIPVWPFIFDGCQLDRDTLSEIQKAGFSSIKYDLYYAPIPHVLYDPERSNLKGVATK